MTQEIVTDYPPYYDEIALAFNLHPRDSIIFSFGARIYNPMDVAVGPELMAHEAVHGQRQGATDSTVCTWWRQYMDNRQFRLEEEVLAHRAEYQYLLANGNRKRRRSALKHTANKLADPMYGSMITRSAATDILRTH